MEVVQVLHMNGGIGETSYANNSLVQQKVISLTRPITEEAITNLYCRTLPRSLAIADLGCYSGPNTLFVVSELIKVVDKLRKKLGHESLEYQVFLNDLPGNDFNTIFKLLPSFQKQMSCQMGPGAGPCLFSGTPGSFYGRLLPSNSLHFVQSSYSLQWLSQVLEGLDNNKGNIYMASTSPPSVHRACYKQFQRDFLVFLKCRADELMVGGGMVLTFLGRRSEDPSSKECCYIWELLAMALNDMVFEVLEGLGNNKGNIYMACTSPPNVLRAYYEQYQRDFSMFLKCCVEELVARGGMVLNFLGRRSENPSSRECCYFWELLAMALNDMVSEGLIDEDKMDSFNVPYYTPSLSKVKIKVLKEGYFSIDRLEVSAIKWNDFDNEFNASNAFSDDGYKVAKYMRVVA